MPKKQKNYINPYKDSYSPKAISGERDACGVGFVAHINGIESNWILKESLRGLDCMEHRGGCGGDSDSVMVQESYVQFLGHTYQKIVI